MDGKKTTELLTLQSADVPAPTPFCLEDHQVSEYYHGMLSQAERERSERHLAACRFCSARIGMLARIDQQGAQSHVPEETLAIAKMMGQPPPQTGTRLIPWATAAVVVLALGVYFQSQYGRKPGAEVEFPAGPPSIQADNLRETRNIDNGTLGPRILSPGEGQITGVNGMIKWTPVPGSLYYRMRIVTDDGDLLWQERIEGTEWQLPANLHLAPGADHYIRIDAYLTEAKSLQSEYVLFRFGKEG